MHIDITRQANRFQFNFAFYNAIDEKVVFTAPTGLAPTTWKTSWSTYGKSGTTSR